MSDFIGEVNFRKLDELNYSLNDGDISFGALTNENKLISLFNMNAEILFKIESINNNMIAFSKLKSLETLDNSDTRTKNPDRQLIKSFNEDLDEDKTKLANQVNSLTNELNDLRQDVARLKSCENEKEKLAMENEDLRAQLDICIADLKIERTLKKSIEAKLACSVGEMAELRGCHESHQRQIDEKKRKFDLDRLMLELKHDAIIEDLNRVHTEEIVELKEKLKKTKSKTSETLQEQLTQLETDLNIEWESKLEKSLSELEYDYECKLTIVTLEKSNLEELLANSEQKVGSLQERVTKLEASVTDANLRLESLALIKRKYEQLQTEVIVRRERFQNRIKELLDADPEPELIGEEVFNSLY